MLVITAFSAQGQWMCLTEVQVNEQKILSLLET